MKKKIIAIIAAIAVVAVAGDIYVKNNTGKNFALLETELHALENTLHKAEALLGESAVSQSEAQSFNAQINGHLDTVDNIPIDTGITNLREEHLIDLDRMIKRLENLLQRHEDDLVALEQIESNDMGDTSDVPPDTGNDDATTDLPPPDTVAGLENALGVLLAVRDDYPPRP